MNGFTGPRPFALFLMVAAAPSAALAAFPAFDNASQPEYAPTFEDGDNGGTNFEPWSFETGVADGAAGFFLAVGNPDLNSIGTGSGPDAWGLFANEGGTGGDDVQLAAATREFKGLGLRIGQTFRISFEHGDIQSGSFVAPGPRTGGFVGFAMRDTFIGPTIDPFNAFGAVNGQFGFGFRGGDGEYTVYDLVTPSGRSTGLPFTDAGVNVELERLGADSYELRAEHADDPSINVVVAVTIPDTTELREVTIYNRNAELGDTFFNSLELTPAVCVGDVGPRGDGVNANDLLTVLGSFGETGLLPYSAGDANGDGAINADDLLAVLADFGDACTP